MPRWNNKNCGFQKDRIVSLKTRQKIGLSNKGKIRSNETKLKLSLSHKGKISKKRNGKIINCLNCNKEFYGSKTEIEKLNKKFCSQFCNSKFNNNGFKKGHKNYRIKPKRLCVFCNKNNVRSKRKYCSQECYGKDIRGEKSHFWKGDKRITPENQRIRSSLEMKLWKKACLQRDNFTCQKTGQKGCRLVVHHINNFSDYPELRTSIKNGITLSKESHEEFHKIYGKRNNTTLQIEEFINKSIISL